MIRIKSYVIALLAVSLCCSTMNAAVNKKSAGKRTQKRSLTEQVAEGRRAIVAPTEITPWVSALEKPKAPMGLDGTTIALWQSHGWYFEPTLNRWEWQRARIFETVEDLYTQSYVMPFLMPMLQNAGAYVASPRERDVRTQEIIIDGDISGSGYSEDNGQKKWADSSMPGFAYSGELLTEGVNPFKQGKARKAETVTDADKASVAQWTTSIPEAGDYAVYVSYQTLPNASSDALYTINAANGEHHFKVNQQMGGGTWVYLGHFPFEKGKSRKPIVELSNLSSQTGGAVSADAVKIGGGMGNVARIVKNGDKRIDYSYVNSGYPRFTEAARYFLQWAGAPDSVYTPTENENDYNDDYRSRPLWVNWLTGGSSMLPKQKGLNVPVDLAFAFHSDAGTTPDDSIIGTLGIYCTDKKAKYANGTPRLAALDLTDRIMTNVTRDVRAQFEPKWTRRDMRDKGYAEARIPEVPTMLLELLSHQNFADMKYGLDPAFRFAVSRSIYKGMLQYIASRDGREYVVQPLPVNAFGITGKNGSYRLSWKATADELEPTATPTYYIVEERVGDGVGFAPIAQTDKPYYDVKVSDQDIHSYRIIAANDGGVSFPSEVLALCDMPNKPQVMIVNGFTRVSAPDWFDAGEIAGFCSSRDHGVPYLTDISFVGEQIEFDRSLPWVDDDAPGFGTSRGNYETKVIAGNTFDYPYLHGQAIAEAGYGFISASVDAFIEMAPADCPKILDLIMGKQKEIQRGTGSYGTHYKTFTAPLQQQLQAYTASGGSLLVSGSYIATDLWNNPYSSAQTAARDKEFAQKVLGYAWRVGQAAAVGEAYEVASPFQAFYGGEFSFATQLGPDIYAVESPDSFYPASDKGAVIMRYNENQLVAGTAYSPGLYRVVALGFPFETVLGAESRSNLMKQILKFLNS